MKTEDVGKGSLRRVGNGRIELVEILQASIDMGIVGIIAPAPGIEIRTRRVHHSMEHDGIALWIVQLIAVDMQRRRMAERYLGPSAYGQAQTKNSR